MPLNETHQATPDTTSAQDPSKAPSSVQPIGARLDFDLDNEEARDLGLSPMKVVGDTANAQKKLTRAKKRTQEEMARDEYLKAEEEVQKLLKLLPTMLSGKTFGIELGKVDRSIAKKIRDATDSHQFDHLEAFKRLASNVGLLRAATKHAKTLLAGGAAAKKIAKEFETSMESVQTNYPEVACLMLIWGSPSPP